MMKIEHFKRPAPVEDDLFHFLFRAKFGIVMKYRGDFGFFHICAKPALACVQEQLTEQRYIHTVGVMETAVKLAERFGADVKKAEIAAIFHDYAKFRPKEEMKQIILNGGGPLEVLQAARPR